MESESISNGENITTGGNANSKPNNEIDADDGFTSKSFDKTLIEPVNLPKIKSTSKKKKVSSKSDKVKKSKSKVEKSN